MLRNADPSRPTSSVPVPGTSTSSRPDEPTSSAAPVRRRIGAATVPAISQPTSAAATDTRTTSNNDPLAQIAEDAVDLVEGAADLERAVGQADRVDPERLVVDVQCLSVDRAGRADHRECSVRDLRVVGERRRDGCAVGIEHPHRVHLEQASRRHGDPAVDGSSDHLTGRLGDRSIDLVDEAGARGAVPDQPDGERRDHRHQRERQRDLPAQAHQPSIRAV